MNLIRKIYNHIRNIIEDKVLSKFFLLHKIENLIMFESIPDMTDNTKPIFDEMIKRGLNKQYKMIWLIQGQANKYPKIDNVEYLQMYPKTFKERMKLYKTKSVAKCLICCNYFLTTLRKGQKSFYFTHGSPLKACSSYYVLPKNIDYCIVQADSWIKPVSKQMVVDEDKIVSLGFPRNDVLVRANRNINQIFNSNFDKIIVWYPTYRQHKSGGKNTGAKNSLPIIHSEQAALALNKYLEEKNVLIVLKPHFAQDVSYIKDLNLSNIKFINDDFFVSNDISSYEFIGSCDSLITDYSSVYYDYTLCNKPIAVVWEDFEEYEKDPGFAVDVNYYVKGAEKIYNIDDFKKFINHIVNNDDIYKKERDEIKEYVNKFTKGESTIESTNFIIDKAGL